jgi:glucan phosphoethanolaminetransferase (alkaline phosphatase superfamily)
MITVYSWIRRWNAKAIGESLSAFVVAVFIFSLLAPNILMFTIRYIDNVDFGLRVLIFPVIATIGLILSIAGRVWLGFIGLVPFAVLVPFEVLYINDFKKPSDAHVFGVIAETNYLEASSFLSDLRVSLIGAISLILIVGIVAVGIAKSKGWQIKGRGRWAILLGSVLALSIPEVAMFLVNERTLFFEGRGALVDRLGSDLTKQLDHPFDYLASSYPIGLAVRSYVFMEQRRALRSAKAELEGFGFQAQQVLPSNDQRQIYLLIIGESGRPDRWQLNGYPRKTNPHLEKVSELVSFRDAVSPWASTRMSVPVMLTRKAPQDRRVFFPEKSFITAFREAGFKTYWYSTQSPAGQDESTISVYASEADEVRYLNPGRWDYRGMYDEVILGPLQMALNRRENKVLFVLHLLGGHFNYAHRHPEAYDIFRPSLFRAASSGLQKKGYAEAVSNSYDNSQIYLDWVLAEIIKTLAASDAIASILYFADHGENLRDGACKDYGHGHENEVDFRVQAFWWGSRQFVRSFPEKATNVMSKRDARIQTSVVFHSMLDMASIRYPGDTLDRSLFSDQWREVSRRLSNGLDFDFAAREGVCRKLVGTESPRETH